MDFADIDVEGWAEEGADLHLHHPSTKGKLHDADGNPVIIRVRGIDSPKVKAIAKRAGRAMEVGQKFDAEKQGMDLLAALTVSWSGIGWEGKDLECNPKNVRFFYEKRDWVAKQVLDFASERRNFFLDASSD